MRSVRLALLAGALALLAFTTFQPHWDPDAGTHPYPVHLDEYVHWGYARAVEATGNALVPDPFGGEAPLRAEGARDPSYPTYVHERGFQAYVAALHAVTGIDWLTLLQFLPVAMTLLLGLAVFALAERWNAGVEAVLWLAAIPTTLRFLGPGFFVPISFSLPLLVIGFFILVNATRARTWLAAALIAAALWPIHALAGFVFSILVALYVLARAPTSRVALLAGAVTLIPFLAAWPYYSGYLTGGILVESDLPVSTETIRILGAIPVALAAVGAAWLVTRKDPSARASGNAMALVLVGAEAILILRHTHGWDPFKLYDRSVTIFFLFACILAGCGVRAVYETLRSLAARVGVRAAAPVLLAGLLLAQGAALGSPIEQNFSQIYAYSLSDSRYENYTLAAERLSPHHQRAIVDGFHTMAWTDVTGIPTLFVHFPASKGPPDDVARFFAEGARDTAFLIRHGVSVVVTDGTVANPDLHEVAVGVYALDAKYAQRLATTARP